MSSNDPKSAESQRKQTRYAVSDDCRVRASIRIRSADQGTASKDWPGTLVDLSNGGAHIRISLGAVAYVGDSCVLKLALGTVKTELRGTLTHYVCSSRYSVCGAKFDYAAAETLQPYLRAVMASSTLKGGSTESDRPGTYREEYSGPGHTKLVVWRENKPEGGPVGFDYVMGKYAAALETAGADMIQNKQQVAFRAAPTASGAPGGPLNKAQEVEARWEFSLAASNLPAGIPADVRRFLRLMS